MGKTFTILMAIAKGATSDKKYGKGVMKF